MVDLGAWLEVEVGEALGWTPLRMSALKMTSEKEEVGVGQLALKRRYTVDMFIMINLQLYFFSCVLKINWLSLFKEFYQHFVNKQ